MTKSFAELKKSSKNSIAELNKKLEALNPATSYKDDNDEFWKPQPDKVGNGEFIIRFLPAPKGEEDPFVRIFKHAFKGPSGSWYIENSLTTIGQPDPVGEMNTQLWNSGSDSDKEQARAQKRKLSYVTNIYVIRDKANPENEGKVFKYAFGKKTFDKLTALMVPEFEDDEPVNPFCLWTGANFRLRMKNVEGYRNYDSSKFDDPAPLFDNDDKMEEVWNQTHSLQALVAPDKFKSYDELKAKLHRVLALDTPVVSKMKRELEEKVQDSPPFVSDSPKKKPSKVIEETEDDDDLAAFKGLVDEDED